MKLDSRDWLVNSWKELQGSIIANQKRSGIMRLGIFSLTTKSFRQLGTRNTPRKDPTNLFSPNQKETDGTGKSSNQNEHER